MRNTYFTKVDDKTWGVTIRNFPRVTEGSGDIVGVRKKDGTVRLVRLGTRITSYLGGRGAIFLIADWNPHDEADPRGYVNNASLQRFRSACE